MKKTITLFLVLLSLQNYAQCWQTISSGSDHTLALKTDGTLWAWGGNAFGELGDGTNIGKNQPVQIGTANWRTISAGDTFSLAIKTDGTLWAWGYNLYGQLGNTNTTSQRSPVQIGTATDWQSVSASTGLTGGHCIALKTNGTLWAWGKNSQGQLGDNTRVDKHQPIQIGVATDWLTIAAGGNHSLAIKATGSLWAWGWNGSYQLGDGTNVDKLVPTQVGTGINWQSIDGSYTHTLGVKTDGTLWAWGFGSDGQLGLGATPIATTPTRVGTDTNWANAVCGINHSLALKTNLTLWSWGKNESGELGLGTNSTTDITAPTQVSTNADKTLILAGQDFSQIMNSDGFLYATGLNAAGQLGDGTNANKSTLTAVTCTALSNEEFQAANTIKVFPNPSKDVLKFTSGEEITKVTLYNLLGQEMASKYVNDSAGMLDISQLNRGTYILRVESSNSIKTVKVVKE